MSTAVVKDVSCFDRNYLEVGLYTEIRFREMGVRFIAVKDGVDSDNAMISFLFGTSSDGPSAMA